MSSGVSLSAGSLLGKQNLRNILADLKFSSRNVNRAARAIPGQWKGIPGAELLGVGAPALPPWWSLAHQCFSLLGCSSCFQSHRNSRCDFTTWSLLMELLIRGSGALVLPF